MGNSDINLSENYGLQTAGTGDEDRRLIHFGFDLRGTPDEDARQYLAFLNYLEAKTGRRFVLRFTPKDGKLDEDLANGVVEVAAVGAVSYLNASQLGNVIPLARGLNKQGKAVYKSVIVTLPGSAIHSIDDLRGKRMAFGGIDSTQGHIIPRLSLNAAGIHLDDLATYVYTGSHRSCANAVIDGIADACAMQDTLGETLESEGKVTIIFYSKNYPSSGIAANTTLPKEILDKITAALIDFDPTGAHAVELYNWGRTEMPNGFIVAKDSDYKDMRANLQKLGLLR